MAKHHLLLACWGALFTAAAATSAVAEERGAGPWKVGSGYAISEGRFGGTDKTTFNSIPFTLEWSTSVWSLLASTSYLRRHGPTGVVIVPDGGALTPAEPVVAIDSARGFGDTYLFATRYYLLDQHRSGINLHLRGIYKLATGSRAKGLSTGKNDVFSGFELTRFFGALEAGAAFTYGRPGKVDEFGLQNHWSTRWRTRWSVSDTFAVDLSYHAGQRYAAGSEPPRDATLGFEWQATRRLKVYLYAIKGYSGGSADSAGGVSLIRSF